MISKIVLVYYNQVPTHVVYLCICGLDISIIIRNNKLVIKVLNQVISHLRHHLERFLKIKKSNENRKKKKKKMVTIRFVSIFGPKPKPIYVSTI